MKRTHCTSCGSDQLLPFLDLGESPIADAYLPAAGLGGEQERLPLQLAVCVRCWLVQLLEQVDAKTLFGTGYSFYSSASAPLSAYHRVYADDILHTYPQLVELGVVEVGCNDGDLLRHFAGTSPLVAGVDPAAGPAAVAAGRGLNVLVTEFGERMVDEEMPDYVGRVGIVLANHVLAHVADLHDVFAGIRKLLHPDGLAVVEVQYLPDLLVNNAFDLVYHEHRQFFSLTSLETAASRWGLHVVDARLTDRQGGSLRAVLRRRPNSGIGGSGSGPALQPSIRVRWCRTDEQWLADWCTYRGLQGRADRIRQRLRQLVNVEFLAGRKVALYGAPAKATTLLHWAGLDHHQIGWAVDTTPAKQGKYVPGTDILIHDPAEAPTADVYLLGAWNYQREIMSGNPGLSWIVPIPAPVLL